MRVDAIAALAEAQVTVGDNIVAVCSLRGATDTGPWTAKAWSTNEREVAVRNIKALLDIPDADDANWGLGATNHPR